MRIYIDADACPAAVRNVAIKAALRLAVEIVFVSNASLLLPEHRLIRFVLVLEGPDSADDYICEHAVAGDLVVTQDIPLAYRLVENEVTVIGLRGEQYDRNNVSARLEGRNRAEELRDLGQFTGGPAPYSDKHKRLFSSALDKNLVRLLKNRA